MARSIVSRISSKWHIRTPQLVARKIILMIAPEPPQFQDNNLKITKLNMEVQLLKKQMDLILQHNIKQDELIGNLLAALTS